jgi:hypothetical protein
MQFKVVASMVRVTVKENGLNVENGQVIRLFLAP